jgi:hypothetical protein
MSQLVKNLTIKNEDFPLLTDTIMTQVGIYKDSGVMPFQRLVALSDVLASCELPPNPSTLQLNNTLLLDAGAGDILTATNNSIIIDNSANSGPTNTISPGDMTINDFGSNTVSQLTADYLSLSNPPSNLTNVSTASNIQIQNVNISTSNTINDKQLLMTDGANTIETEISNDVNISAEPYIRMRNNVGLDNYYYRSAINADGHNNFTFENNNSFFKQNNPFSFLTYKLNDGDYIEKNYSFVYCYNLTVIKLYNPTNYIDDNGNDGWSCIVSNHSGSDIQIDTAGFDWYAHSHGQQPNPIQLKKWSTCRITLINSPGYGDFIWAVSQF